MDGGQSRVSCPHGVSAITFEVVQERPDQGGVKVLEPKAGWGFAGLSFDETEQEAKGVSVSGDGVGARPALGHEPLGEERFECGGQRAHGCSFAPRRAAARASSSGAADKYQYVLAGWT